MSKLLKAAAKGKEKGSAAQSSDRVADALAAYRAALERGDDADAANALRAAVAEAIADAT